VPPFSRRNFLLGLVTTTALGGTELVTNRTVSAAPPTPLERASIESVIAAFMDLWSVPGLSVAVAHHGELLYSQGFGIADPATGEMVTSDHLFRIASVTKPITATAIFALIERGKLQLTDRVFGPDGIPGSDCGAPPYNLYVGDITIDHLLTHSCGGWTNDAHDPMNQQPGLSQADLITWTLSHAPLAAKPGALFQYSNFGFCLLGRVIEKVSGQSYASFVSGEVLAKCGIDGMRIGGNTAAERAPMEVTYHDQDGDDPYGVNLRRMDSCGGWLARSRDLVQFLLRVDGFPLPPDILRKATIDAMTANNGLRDITAHSDRYARGWFVNPRGDYWHTGLLAGSSTLMVRTSTGFCWAALSNTRRHGTAILDALDQMMWDIAGQANWAD